MSKKSSETTIFKPEIKQITNASITKKDLLEILEVEATEKIETRVREISKRRDELSTILLKLDEEFKKEWDKEVDRVKKLEKNKIRKLVIESELEFDEKFLQISCSTVDTHYPNESNGSHKYISVLSNYNNTMIYIQIRRSYEFSECYSQKRLDIEEKCKEIGTEQKRLSSESCELHNQLNNLPKELKKMSANITKTMLRSDSTGIGLLDLLKQQQLQVEQK